MTHGAMSLFMGILLVTVAACERQGPPPKPIGSATNKHVEEAPAPPARTDADTIIQHMKTPMENARHAEDVLKGAADRTRQESEPATQ